MDFWTKERFYSTSVGNGFYQYIWWMCRVCIIKCMNQIVIIIIQLLTEWFNRCSNLFNWSFLSTPYSLSAIKDFDWTSNNNTCHTNAIFFISKIIALLVFINFTLSHLTYQLIWCTIKVDYIGVNIFREERLLESRIFPSNFRLLYFFRPSMKVGVTQNMLWSFVGKVLKWNYLFLVCLWSRENREL